LLQRVIKNSASVLGGNVVLRGCDLLVILLAARRLPMAEFGKLTLVLSFYSLYRLAGDGGLQHLLIREMAQNKSNASRYFADSFAFQVGWSVVLTVIYISTVLALGYSGDTYYALFIALIAIMPDNLVLPFTSAIQAYEKMEYLLIINSISSILRLVTSVALLLTGYGFTALIWCMMLSRIAGFLVAQHLVRRHILVPSFSTNFASIGILIKQLLPFMGITIVSALFLRADTIFLSRLAGDRSVAIFGVGARLVEPALLVLGGVALAIYPAIAALYKTDRNSLINFFQATIRASLLVGMIGVCFGSILAKPIILWLFPNYFPSVPVVKIFLWYLAIFAVDQVSGRLLLGAGRQYINLKLISLGTIVLVPLLFLLIPLWGPSGAALADTIAFAVVLIIELIVVGHILPEVNMRRSFLIPVIGLFVVWSAGQIAERWGIWAQFIVTMACGVPVVICTGLLQTNDYYRLQDLICNWRRRHSGIAISSTREENL
jgi:O-antigen/teichoic acid export membrane protein